MTTKQITKPACSFPECGKPALTKGLCSRHYCQQWEGKPLTALRHVRNRNSPPEIIWDEVTCPNPKLIGPCHIFRGYKGTGGYSQVRVKGKHILVHRYVWEQANDT